MNMNQSAHFYGCDTTDEWATLCEATLEEDGTITLAVVTLANDTDVN